MLFPTVSQVSRFEVSGNSENKQKTLEILKPIGRFANEAPWYFVERQAQVAGMVAS